MWKIINNLIKATLIFFCIRYSLGDLANPKCKEYTKTYSNPYSNHRYLFFTNISCNLTILVYFLCLIHRVFNIFYHTCNIILQLALACEFTTTSIFWSLYFYNKELIVSKSTLKPGYETPLIENLASHIFPYILLILEQADFNLSVDKLVNFLIVFFCIFYYLITKLYAITLGSYIYNFLNLMSEKYRILFFVSVAVVLLIFHNLFLLIKSKLAAKRIESSTKIYN